jgi:hypothetical protein
VSYLHLASAPPMAGVAGVGAFSSGLSMFGQTPLPRLSPGQFGLAMSRVDMPREALQLLLLSATFKQMAQTLDNSYLDHRHWFALQQNNPNLKLNKAFRVVGGGAGLNGRRIFYLRADDSGSMFIPGSSIDSPTGWDYIWLKLSLWHEGTIAWVETLAHETAHAFARVTATGTGPKTPEQRVKAAVLDECATRKREQKVVSEIKATPTGRKAFAGHTLRPVRTCDCERDWFPAVQKRTYLEQFVLGMDWESAAQALSDTDRKKILADVAAIPLKWSKKPQPPTMIVAILRGTAPVGSFAKQFPVLKSTAGQAAFVLRIVDASWRQLMKKVGEDSAEWTGGAHQLRLERHARVFFKIKVSYTKCA